MSVARQLARARRLPSRLKALLFLHITDVVYVLDVANYRAAAAKGEMIVYRPLRSSDRALLAAGCGEAKAVVLIARLATSFGVVALVDGQVAGYSWMTTQPRAGEGEAPFFYDVAPKAGWAYMFDTLVLPNYRGKGIASELKRRLIEEAKIQAVKFCVATHDQGNLAVIHVSERLGFRLHGKMEYSRVLGLAKKNLAGLPEGIRP